ncbi:malonic semialdehyde reductase [Streptomyces luteolus]|uniref:Malonic semialdehyde reductase n=1 Tax=Streptomyces luteolus TaxID=3043615 RepID=A0ABT6T2K4_9ACTN|nr:malonic semialdehyde reductase [Streptomyces sp. B-S-A12]MDI3422104.1 malonic semialdehyde reductase [Streptomyces sp. B-S-A12]
MNFAASAPAHETLTLAADAQDLLFNEAHTAHTYTSEPVSDAQLAAIHELVKNAPTSLNSQPLRAALVRSDSARDRLVAQMAPGNRPKARQAPLVVVLATDLDFHETLARVAPHVPDARELFSDETMRHESAVVNASLQIAYFILGVRAAGLAVGPMSGFDAPAVTEEFFPGGRHRALVVANVGHPGPDAFRPRAPRLEFGEVFKTV